ncbi:hypothetical protein P692DRAFT_20834986 [Suillus brevipes Sb2]|nr:hypothetical protein P692DRAFT_20834986 [Suillus brevipes Sb2]
MAAYLRMPFWHWIEFPCCCQCHVVVHIFSYWTTIVQLLIPGRPIRLKAIYQRPPLLESSSLFNTSSCNSSECKHHLLILSIPKIYLQTRYN